MISELEGNIITAIFLGNDSCHCKHGREGWNAGWTFYSFLFFINIYYLKSCGMEFNFSSHDGSSPWPWDVDRWLQ